MAKRVYLHIGAPKTGTTYLQDICLHNRDLLAEQGVRYVGERWIDHVHANMVIREHPRLKQLPAAANRAWDRFVEECRAWPGTAIISHEFLAAASAAQAARAIRDLHPAEVHVVFTARDYTRLLPALWQQHLKYGLTTRLSEWSPEHSDSSLSEFSWRTVDPVGVLERWGVDLPPRQVHVVTVPQSGGDSEELWRRFAQVCGIDPQSCDTSVSRANASLGVVEAELLRRSNEHRAEQIRGPREVSRWIHHTLALRILVPRKGQSFGLSAQAHADARTRSERMISRLQEAGYDVVGDLRDLVSAKDAPVARTTDQVADSEIAEAAVEVIAELVAVVRARTLERDKARAKAASASWKPSRLSGLTSRLRIRSRRLLARRTR